MNTKFDRNYYVLKTMSGDAIGLVSLIVPTNETGTFEFSLHQPECKDKPNEFLDLMYTEMDFAEYETHRDVFETYDEIEVVKEWVSSGVAIPITVLVKKKEKSDEQG